ncbi:MULTISPECIES: SsgA family sporulation/cell division regulator [Kitasatospora]|uniref:SsgA family sporulation/cell division regulator n=1 Tax=Kitasatospora cathayae TaxID=3004092 RepID=A0ABY7PYK8_9ACTN|nr:SsgA family sporulation/cell division regulator [Kitasatospora sp. HUAS 3-15]WBP85282.1 SsgA family sporulation/cell division regulator [Kitasatospora sp. HUAS 3-15]
MERLTTRITMRLMTGDDRSRDLDVDWSYRAGEPHAVELDFTSYQAEAVWSLSRDLLIAGLHEPSGEGDVHVTPFDDTRLLIALAGGEGVALLVVSTGAVARFLAATVRLVPLGQEHARIDWDRGLKALLTA